MKGKFNMSEKHDENTMLSKIFSEAVKKAVDDCISENILRDFLLKHGEEVVETMARQLSFEYAIELKEKEISEKAAKKMLLDNEPIEKIVRYTELTEEQVLELKNKIAEK
jgi:hypothetical protein